MPLKLDDIEPRPFNPDEWETYTDAHGAVRPSGRRRSTPPPEPEPVAVEPAEPEPLPDDPEKRYQAELQRYLAAHAAWQASGCAGHRPQMPRRDAVSKCDMGNCA